MIIDVMKTCNDQVLAGILNVVRNILLIIQIAVPIILIIWSGIEFFKLVTNPDAKGGTKKIINKFIAAAIVFLIPTLINVTMGLVGESTNFSSCWKNAKEISTKSNYTSEEAFGKKQKTPTASDYESAKKK